MISYNESLEILNSINVEPTKVVEVPLMDAQDMFLAEDIIASCNMPQFPTAGMDGYAIKYEDQALGELKVVAINPAGADEIAELIGGKAIKTFTGSLMPKGSDTLIPIENVEFIDEKIVIKEEVPFGFSVREVGENFKKGEVLIKKGTKIDFPQIAVLASLNYVTVKVYSKVKVDVIETGCELLEL
jgi:molybdopterin molybdotransferase